jgi:hypothetical protein
MTAAEPRELRCAASLQSSVSSLVIPSGRRPTALLAGSLRFVRSARSSMWGSHGRGGCARTWLPSPAGNARSSGLEDCWRGAQGRVSGGPVGEGAVDGGGPAGDLQQAVDVFQVSAYGSLGYAQAAGDLGVGVPGGD